MKTLAIIILTLFLACNRLRADGGNNQWNNQANRTSSRYNFRIEYRRPHFIPDQRLIDAAADIDNTNEISDGSFYPIYQPLLSPPSTLSPVSISTQLKQLSPSNHFTPMVGVNSPPTPVVMQYYPQNQMVDGVHYVQLIPTRPLLIPISPYIAKFPNTYPITKTLQTTTSTNSPFLPTVPATLPPAPASSFQPIISTNSDSEIAAANSSPISVTISPTLTLLSSNYRYFRPNSGMEIVNSPPDLSLNTNEYLPKPGENNAASGSRIIKGRP